MFDLNLLYTENSWCTYRLIDVSLMITTKQKSTAETQEIVRRESKHNTKKVIKSEEKRKGNREDLKNNHKAISKMAKGTYLRG